jgi:hypothetical protein
MMTQTQHGSRSAFDNNRQKKKDFCGQTAGAAAAGARAPV